MLPLSFLSLSYYHAMKFKDRNLMECLSPHCRETNPPSHHYLDSPPEEAKASGNAGSGPGGGGWGDHGFRKGKGDYELGKAMARGLA